jgi:hypothetical protein
MNQGRTLPRWSHVVLTGCLALTSASALAQNAGRASRMAQPSNEPNRTGEADAAATSLVDSLFTPFAPADPLATETSRALGATGTRAAKPKWAGKLARNPNPGDGNAAYVLIDRYGGIQRYVEPVKGIDLSKHIGQTITVRRDTGGTLLASQLELPRSAVPRGAALQGTLAAAPGRAGARNAAPRDSGVRQAAMQEEMPSLVPTPADDSAAPMPTAEGAPSPTGEVIEGEIIDHGHEGHEHMVYEGGAYEGHEGYEGYQEGMVIPDGVDPLYLDGQSEMGYGGSCPTCGDAVCGGGGCGFGSRPIFYARGEYLHWWFDGMPIPPLVVRGEVNDNGTTGDPSDDFFDNAVVVFGGNSVLDDGRSGGRITLGYFLDDCGKLGIEADYLAFGEVDTHFTDGGDGVFPIVGRPFIDATTGLPAVEDVSFPGIQGTVTVDIESEFQSAGVRLRRNLCCVAGCTTGCGDGVACGSGVGGCDSCSSCGGAGCPMCPLLGSWIGKQLRGGTRHVDVLYGVRWARLNERLHVNEDLIADDDTTFLIDDDFRTTNEFFGGEIGFLVDWQKQRWSVDFLSKLAIGSNRQRVAISAQTIQDGILFPDIGLLGQPSNVGVYEQNEFSVIPEIGLTGGYQLTERLRLTLGYTLLYFSNVVRPGDQIDLRVNPEFLDLVDGDPSDTAADAALIQPQSPEFVFRRTDIWAHGFNAGLDYRW